MVDLRKMCLIYLQNRLNNNRIDIDSFNLLKKDEAYYEYFRNRFYTDLKFEKYIRNIDNNKFNLNELDM